MAVDLRAIWDQVPLAEAFWLLWEQALPDTELDQLFESHRGRCYQRCFAFSDLVHLVADALSQHRGRVHPTLTRHADSERCPASVQAFYGKLRRIPAAVSDALVGWNAQQLRPHLPPRAAAATIPAAMAALRVLVFDGRTAKGAAKRLRPLRGKAGAALGGRTLAVLDVATGLVVGMKSHPHGHVNEQLLVSDALEHVRQASSEPRVWVADRAFGNLANLKRCTRDGDHAILRKHSRTVFRRDRKQPVRTGVDAEGRPYRDEIGIISSTREGQQVARQITVKRGNLPDLVILTSLTDADAYPAVDILAIYALRWNIEEMFQKVSEVLQLSYLIGSHPRAIMFQTGLCLMMANVLTVLRGIVASAQSRPVETISVSKFWYDLHRQLTACHVLARPNEIVIAVRQRQAKVANFRTHLRAILKSSWTERWVKSPPKKRHLPKAKHRRGGKAHFSIHTVLEESRG